MAMRTDPLLVRNQPALRTGTRRRWLLPAGAVALVAVGMLAATFTIHRVLATVGIGLIAALYLAMAACALAIESVPRRNLVLAWLMGSMAVTAVVALLGMLIEATERR